MYDPRMDDLLDYASVMRRRVDLLRDALSDALAELPDGDPWRGYADLFVLTDPDLNAPEDVEAVEAVWVGGRR